ncbi:hypothetical protein DFH08DRAFT_136640 [Mycena albidolilacea]|uniref:F-box domain-containing protein n=1 Tax=Mycena albidolilacea TaxID=1033008 RepID=A0AAD7ESD1_9AGAR|nr:hypothetical protein DFH08DRAFT_136640 [Mycena albidolilacea]
MAEIFLQLAAIETKAQSHLSLIQNYYHDDEILGKEYLVRPIPHAAPLIFGQISRKWRAVALSTPGLWNSISLKCTDEEMEDNISLYNTWLQRSGVLSLSFQFYRPIDSPRDVSPKFVDDCQILFRTILPHAKRWRSVDLKNFPASSYQAPHDLLPNSALVLETLSVSYDWREQPVSTPWVGLCTAPKLRLLYFDHIDRANIMVGGEWPTFPWSQLTHIDVGDCSAYDCLQILSEALTAVACQFVVQRPSFLQHPPISHPGLQTLKIEVYNTGLPVWNLLTCPTLSTLSVEARTYPIPDYRFSNSSFLPTSLYYGAVLPVPYSRLL